MEAYFNRPMVVLVHLHIIQNVKEHCYSSIANNGFSFEVAFGLGSQWRKHWRLWRSDENSYQDNYIRYFTLLPSSCRFNYGFCYLSFINDYPIYKGNNILLFFSFLKSRDIVIGIGVSINSLFSWVVCIWELHQFSTGVAFDRDSIGRGRNKV